jgi:hypothetical protein
MTQHVAAGGPAQPDPQRRTVLPLHPQHDHHVRQALHVALHALAERATTYRLLQEDPEVYGLADPDWLDRSAATDEAATAVLQALLADGARPGLD